MVVDARHREEPHVQGVVGVVMRDDDVGHFARRHAKLGEWRQEGCLRRRKPWIDDDRNVPVANQAARARDGRPGRAGEQDVEARATGRGCIGHDATTIRRVPWRTRVPRSAPTSLTWRTVRLPPGSGWPSSAWGPTARPRW